MAENKQYYEVCADYFSADKLRIIKESLVSRNEPEVIGAVESLMQYVDNEQILVKVMKSDVPVLLSEAIFPGKQSNRLVFYLFVI